MDPLAEPLFELIWLIDDNAADNYLHNLIVRGSGLGRSVEVFTMASEALEVLAARRSRGEPTPDLLFLDLNMPAVDGWEFLKQLDELDPTLRSSMGIYVLSTSVDPDDEKRATHDRRVEGFIPKPLTLTELMGIAEGQRGDHGA